MNKKNILLAALISASFAAWAEEPADTKSDAKIERNVTIRTAGDGPMSMVMPPDGSAMHFDSMVFGETFTHFRGKTVKNAPYSAEVISERVQKLPDGNEIVNKTSTLHYRDAAGRTRQESRSEKGEVRRISIFDPAENATYVLNPRDKTATKLVIKMDMQHARMEGDKAREKARARLEELKKEGKVTMTETKDGNGVMIVKNIERGDGTGDGTKVITRENIQVRVAEAVSKGLNVEMARVAPIIANAFNDGKWSSKRSNKDLGTKDIDGIKAEGKMNSYEIPAGEVGNKNPIVVSSESWYSPDLQITVYSKQSDPRVGDRIYRLANLKRDEPVASLFTVPSDYTVKDISPQMRTSVEKVYKIEKADKSEKADKVEKK